MISWWVAREEEAPLLMARPPVGQNPFNTIEEVILDHLSRVDRLWREVLPVDNVRREGRVLGRRMRRELREEGKKITIVIVYG